MPAPVEDRLEKLMDAVTDGYHQLLERLASALTRLEMYISGEVEKQ